MGARRTIKSLTEGEEDTVMGVKNGTLRGNCGVCGGIMGSRGSFKASCDMAG